jgi:hypothetical protein
MYARLTRSVKRIFDKYYVNTALIHVAIKTDGIRTGAAAGLVACVGINATDKHYTPAEAATATIVYAVPSAVAGGAVGASVWCLAPLMPAVGFAACSAFAIKKAVLYFDDNETHLTESTETARDAMIKVCDDCNDRNEDRVYNGDDENDDDYDKDYDDGCYCD